MSSQETRRSQRLRAVQARRPPIEVITISSSDDESEDLEIVEIEPVDRIVSESAGPSNVRKEATSTKSRQKQDRSQSKKSQTIGKNNVAQEDSSSISGPPPHTSAVQTETSTESTSQILDPPSPMSIHVNLDQRSSSSEKKKSPPPSSTPKSTILPISRNQKVIPSSGDSPRSCESPTISDVSSEKSSEQEICRSKRKTTQPVTSNVAKKKSVPIDEKMIIDQTTRLEPGLDISKLVERIERRKLIMEKIVGAIKPRVGPAEFIVKWKGLTQLEKMSLPELKLLFPDKLVEFMCQRIVWKPEKPRVGRTPKKHPQ